MGFLSFSFEELADAVRIFESSIAAERASADQRHQQRMQAALSPFAGPSTVFQQHALDQWRTEFALPTIFRRSLFISIYSLVEHWLNRFCDVVQSEKNLATSFRDTKGNDKGIQRAKVYLKKIGRIDFPSDTPEWQSLCDYNLVRNFLAHNDGILPDSEKGRREATQIKRLKHVDISYEREIFPMPGFCEEALAVSERFFALLFRAYAPYSDV